MPASATTELPSKAARLRADLRRAGFAPDAVVTDPHQVEVAGAVWNGQVTARPVAIARCTSASEVQAALQTARSAGVPVSVRGGGHDWAGRAVRAGGLLIDLSQMRGVEIDGDTARVGGGGLSSDVLDAALRHDRSAVLGSVGLIGAVGFTLGGGYGPLIGTAGLAADNLLSAQVVLADGRVVTADEQHESDLFWALRGGGGSFGVVTEIRIRLFPRSHVVTGTVAFGWNQARSVLRGLRDLTDQADDALHVGFAAAATPDGPVLLTSPSWSGDPHEATAQIGLVTGLGTPVHEQVSRVPLAARAHALDEMFPRGDNYHCGSSILPALTPEAIDAFVSAAETMPAKCLISVNHAHGAALRVPVDATAHAYREEHLIFETLGRWDRGDGRAEKAWVRETESGLSQHALTGGWAVFLADGDPRIADAFGPNTSRLLAAKARYDPAGVFVATPLPA